MLKVYLDASTKGNPGPSGGGIVIVGTDLHEQIAFPLPDSTNHQAEFAVMVNALQLLIDNYALYRQQSRCADHRQELYQKPCFF